MAAAASWLALGHSVRGASHVRDGLPNQDSLLIESVPGASAHAIAAVADGHGGARHFRSGDGARIAVASAREALLAMRATLAAATTAERARLAAVELPLRIVSRWVELAQADLAARAIGEGEWAALSAAEGDDAVATVRADPLLAYGATVLAALVLPGCIVLAQLGDGDLVAVDAAGRSWRPVPHDERLGGNITTSLCRPGAEADFRACVLAPVEPLLLLLATDGYANSFRSDADFLQVGGDFLGLLRQHGAAAVEQQLGGILEHASTHGSGDDITLALLVAPAATAASVAEAAAPGAGTTAMSPGLSAIERRVQRQRQVIIALALALVALVAWTQRDRLNAAFKPRPLPVVLEPAVVVPKVAPDSGLVGDGPGGSASAPLASPAVSDPLVPGLGTSAPLPRAAGEASAPASAPKKATAKPSLAAPGHKPGKDK